MKKDDRIGVVEVTLAKIMSAPNTTLVEDLIVPGKNTSRGKIIIRADSVAASNDELEIKASAKLISRGGTCCRTDNPYL